MAAEPKAPEQRKQKRFATVKKFNADELRSSGAQKSFKEQHLVAERPLTEPQKKIIELVAAGETPYAASKIVDYPPNHVYALLKRPYVQAQIAEKQAAFAEANKMTRQKVMDGMLEAIEMAKLMAEPSTMVSGWREIGKMCGFYEPAKVKVDVNVSGNVVMERMNQMTDAELLDLIQNGPRALENSSDS